MEEKLKNIEVVVFDGFGVFFDERVFVEPGKPEVSVMRSHADGQGISLLRSAQFSVGLLSTEKTGFMDTIGEKINNLPSVKDGRWKKIELFTGDKAKNKTEAVLGWVSSLGFRADQCAYMGDDIGDYEIMKKVGFAAAPLQAEEIIKEISDWVAPRRGGDGAVRDFCNLLLKIKGINPITLTLK